MWKFVVVAENLTQVVRVISNAPRFKSGLKEFLKMAPALKLMLALRVLNTILATNLILLLNDVASSPGPFDLRVPSQGRGITVGSCGWAMEQSKSNRL